MERSGRHRGAFAWHLPTNACKITRSQAAGDALTVRPYDENLLHVCQPGITSVDLEPLLDPDTADYAINPDQYILATDGLERADVADIQTYSDPLLQVKAEQFKLICNLKRKGLICFRRNRVCIIGPFTVDKKRGAS